jgi:hypothetical protein
MTGCASLQHHWQLGALRPVSVIPIHCRSLGAVTGNLIQPIDKLSVTASIIDEANDPVATRPATLVTSHAQHIELADKITEDDCAVAGHGGNHRIAANIENKGSSGYGCV